MSEVNGIVMPDYHGTGNQYNWNEHQTSKDWSVTVSVGGYTYRIFINSGFIFDGASIPRALWRLCGHPFTCPRVAAALAHDWLYASHVVDRETADKIYRELQKVLGIGFFSRNTEYYTLRLFGGAAWNEKTATQINDANYLGRIEVYEIVK